jgi:hypothetical protein
MLPTWNVGIMEYWNVGLKEQYHSNTQPGQAGIED